MEEQITITKKEYHHLVQKANKWDELDHKIGSYYLDEDGEELPDDEGGDLADIGEVAAMAFGYL